MPVSSSFIMKLENRAMAALDDEVDMIEDIVLIDHDDDSLLAPSPSSADRADGAVPGAASYQMVDAESPPAPGRPARPLSVERPPPPPRRGRARRPLGCVSLMAVVVFLSAIGGFLFGYDLGLVSGALEYIEEDMHLSERQDQLVVMAAKAGAFFGTFIGGASMLAYGRRRSIACSAVFFIAGPVMMAAAGNVTLLVAGRLSIGVGIGVSAVVVPAYLGELSPPSLRGRVVAVYEVAVAFGMFVAPLVDFMLKDLDGKWRYMVAMPLLPAALLMAAVAMLPESPRWLVQVGDYDAALRTLESLRQVPGDAAPGRRPDGGDAARESDDERTRLSPDAALAASATTIIAEGELMEIWSTDQKNKAAASDARSALSITSSGNLRASPRSDDGGECPSSSPARGGGGGAGGPGAMPRTLGAAMAEMAMDFRELTRGADRSAFCIAMWLALVNQLCASTAIINYGPKLLDKLGSYDRDERILMTVVLALVKMIGTRRRPGAARPAGSPPAVGPWARGARTTRRLTRPLAR